MRYTNLLNQFGDISLLFGKDRSLAALNCSPQRIRAEATSRELIEVRHDGFSCGRPHGRSDHWRDVRFQMIDESLWCGQARTSERRRKPYLLAFVDRGRVVIAFPASNSTCHEAPRLVRVILGRILSAGASSLDPFSKESKSSAAHGEEIE